MNLENEAAYLFITAILKELLMQELITKAQFRQIDRYNAEVYHQSVDYVC